MPHLPQRGLIEEIKILLNVETKRSITAEFTAIYFSDIKALQRLNFSVEKRQSHLVRRAALTV